MKTEAISAISDVKVNESSDVLYEYMSGDTSVQILREAEEPADDAEEDVSIDDGPEKIKQWTFVEWVPDPTKPENLRTPNRNKDPHNGAVVVCAKFKIEESEGIPPEKDEDGESGKGDDLYIIPMPGVKYRNEDDDGFQK